MIISTEKKFIFFHLYKVAGSSIRDCLLPHSTFVHDNAHLKPCQFKDMKINNGQTGYDIMHNYYTFAFVRNPWDWQVSLFHYMQQTTFHPQHHVIKNMSFEEYLNWRVDNDLKTQYQFLSIDGDNTSEIQIDKIGKFESLEKDFTSICNELNIECDLKHTNKSVHDEYKTYYSKKSRDLVTEHFRKDIEYFDYNF